jgi:hypothetical protein
VGVARLRRFDSRLLARLRSPEGVVRAEQGELVFARRDLRQQKLCGRRFSMGEQDRRLNAPIDK